MTYTTLYRNLEGKLGIYHPNKSCNGSAARIELRPARRGRDGYIFVEVASQKTCPQFINGDTIPATFNWDSRLGIKLGFSDVCSILAVLEGRLAAAGGDKGMFHQTRDTNTMINFKRVEQPFVGYSLEISRKSAAANDPVRLRITFAEAEGCGLRQIFSAAVFHLCFYEAPPSQEE